MGKEVSTTDWVYLGTHITIPPNSHALLLARRAYRTGAPLGVCISKDSEAVSTNIVAIEQPTTDMYNNHALNVSTCVEPGTYYLWSKGNTGESSEVLYALIFPDA